MIVPKFVAAEPPASGAVLHADELLAQVVQGDVGALLDDDHLHTGGIGVGEVHDRQTLLVDGDARHDHVAHAGLGGLQGGGEVHVVDDQLQAQLVGDGLGDLHVDALKAAVIGGHLIGREGGVGGHDEFALLNGGELAVVAGGAALIGCGGLLGLGHVLAGGLAALAVPVAAGGQGKHQAQSQQYGQKFFHGFHFPLSPYPYTRMIPEDLEWNHYTSGMNKMQAIFEYRGAF